MIKSKKNVPRMEERCIHGFGQETCAEETTWKS